MKSKKIFCSVLEGKPINLFSISFSTSTVHRRHTRRYRSQAQRAIYWRRCGSFLGSSWWRWWSLGSSCRDSLQTSSPNSSRWSSFQRQVRRSNPRFRQRCDHCRLSGSTSLLSTELDQARLGRLQLHLL